MDKHILGHRNKTYYSILHDEATARPGLRIIHVCLELDDILHIICFTDLHGG